MRLEELGYDPGPIDGIIGEKTAHAIKQFQHDNDLLVTGKLDEKTIEKLSSSPQTEEKEIHIIGKTGESAVVACENGTCEYGDDLVFMMKDGI
jgi:peptidoglycan hydrolase-like protein with peptidoglycan-binding domain